MVSNATRGSRSLGVHAALGFLDHVIECPESGASAAGVVALVLLQVISDALAAPADAADTLTAHAH